MAKEEMLEFEGVVAEVLPDARCRVKLDNGHEVVAYTSGRMKKNRIRILAGSGISAANVGELLASTGVHEVHASCRTLEAEPAPELVAFGFAAPLKRGLSENDADCGT